MERHTRPATAKKLPSNSDTTAPKSRRGSADAWPQSGQKCEERAAPQFGQDSDRTGGGTAATRAA